jgi:predicted nucleic acid-binding protein
MIALDTNILIYAHRSSVPQHRAAMRAIEEVAGGIRGWGIPFPCIAEFWAVVTHPASSGRPSRPREAQMFLENLVDAGAKVLYPRNGTMARLSKLAVELNVRGARIFDLQIGLTCQEAGAREIWSHDRSFIAVPGMVINDPL